MENVRKDFEQMVSHYEKTIYSICYMYSCNEDDAKDLLQDTLLNLWNGFTRFLGKSSLRTWVIRVTINTCISFKRKKKLPTCDDSFLPSVIDATPSAGKQIRLLYNRMHNLDYLDRALVLLWLENLSYDEIGNIIGMPAKNVGVRLVRIKNKLKNIRDDE